jgi:subtilisin family serine protease
MKIETRLLLGLIISALPLLSRAQQKNWQNLDLKTDGVFGISTEKAYKELLKGKTSHTVIVAIIDGGIDTSQEDLKQVIWRDPKTGIHGWNYIAAETGKEDITKLVGNKSGLFDSLAYMEIPPTLQAAFKTHQELSPALESKVYIMKRLVGELDSVRLCADTIVKNIGKENPLIDDFKAYQPQNQNQIRIRKIMLKRMPFYSNWKTYQYAEITDILNKASYHVTHGLNADNNETDTATGNKDISFDKLGPLREPGSTAYHGTHVAGIIGAVRGNGTGMDGVTDNVKLMMLKNIGNIRELRDKNFALAIRFAVDHGAKVINMSFGKPYTWDKKDVDKAVKYAMKKDVLMVCAAGNNGEDIDKRPNYPNPVYADGSGRAKAWIEVGASNIKDDENLVANFSNYGKRTVDVFAPGVDIYSTLPYDQYDYYSGTSMATPLVTALAALIREYYPNLTAIQVKDIIMKSVVKVGHNVKVGYDKVPFSKLCVSGGIVNAYQALKLAATYD